METVDQQILESFEQALRMSGVKGCHVVDVKTLAVHAFCKSTVHPISYVVLGAWAKSLATEVMGSSSVLKFWTFPLAQLPATAATLGITSPAANADATLAVPVLFLNEATFKAMVRTVAVTSACSVDVFHPKGVHPVIVGCSASTPFTVSARVTAGTISLFEELLDASGGGTQEGSGAGIGVGGSGDPTASLQGSSIAAANISRTSSGMHHAASSNAAVISIAIGSFNQRTFIVSEFIDSTVFSQLQSLGSILTQFNIRELYVPESLLAYAQGAPEELSQDSGGASSAFWEDVVSALKAISRRGNISLQFVPKGNFSEKLVLSKLNGLLRVDGEKMILPSLSKGTMQSMGCLLEKIQPLLPGVLAAAAKALQQGDSEQEIAVAEDDEIVTNIFRLLEVKPNTILRLDSTAVDTLNVVAPVEARAGKLPLSLFGWLMRSSATSMGSRLMRQWLLQPSTDLETISGRHMALEVFVESPMLRDAIQNEVLRPCPDMDRLCRRLQCHTASLREMALLMTFVHTVATCVKVLHTMCLDGGSPSSPSGDSVLAGCKRLLVDDYMYPLEEMRSMMGNLVTLIEATIDTTEDGEFIIRSEFDDELQVLSESRKETRKAITQEFQKVSSRHGWTEKICKCELHPTYGFVMRVTRKEDKPVRDDSKLTIVQTSKDGVRFVSDHFATLSSQYKDVSRAYELRQKALHKKLVETVESYLPLIDDAKELLARLDVFAAWAKTISSSRLPFCRPEMTSMTTLDGNNDVTSAAEFSLIDVWHPLVEARTGQFRSNSVKLERQPQGKSSRNAMIITGPNMGGKSTLMRSIGCATVLAQAGCFVPCSSAKIPIRDSVQCRIGATDYMSQGVSTFMVEMLETSAILATATQNSLVIIDELGRGTSTFDGFGLAWAVAHHLACATQCFLLFSTHFHELTELADEAHGVEVEGRVLPPARNHVFNSHFGAEVSEEGKLTFGYHLAPGACTKSFGIEVAQLAGLPEEVITSAKQRAKELEDFEGDTSSSENGSGAASVQKVLSMIAEHPDKGGAELANKLIQLGRDLTDGRAGSDAASIDNSIQDIRSSAQKLSPHLAELLKGQAC